VRRGNPPKISGGKEGGKELSHKAMLRVRCLEMGALDGNDGWV